MPKMWFKNETLELEIIYHVLKSFKNFARAVGVDSRKIAKGSWDVLLKITWVKYVVLSLELFSS